MFLSLNSFAQINIENYYERERQAKKDKWTKLALFTGAIVLNGLGDGFNDSGNKEWGHVCNAASIGLTLSIPLIIYVDKSNWYWYLLEYTFIRFAMFDYTYNLAAGNDYDYIGNSNYYDKMLNKQNHLLFPKTLSLVLGIAINFNE